MSRPSLLDAPGDGLSRRSLLRVAASGLGVTAASSWLPAVIARGAETDKRRKSCILLWMSGGPSHLDTFDLKPGTLEGGEFRPIATSAPGIEISEHFPQLSRWMHHAAIVRSMNTGEADHGRAGILMHTGFRPTSGGLKHPNLGAIASAELGEAGSLLPNFVVCGQGNRVDPSSAGFLGPQHEGLTVLDAAKGLDDLKPSIDAEEFTARVDLLARLQDTGRIRPSSAALAQRATYSRAVDLMRSDKARAFDLALEPQASSAKYGSSPFGQGCLLARRLIEVGVPFVEVVLPGWDTHQKNFTTVKALSQVVDTAMSALIGDLKEQSLLDDTLVIWMGEFGRTPRINNGGRDHYARAWSTVLVGGGIPGGQVIGRTDEHGAQVEDRPVSVAVFMATVCTILGIRTDKVYEGPGGRTIRLLDDGPQPLRELSHTART